MRPLFPIISPDHSSALIRVLFKTGKHAGQDFTLLDVPGVIVHSGHKLIVTLPGLEGEAILLPPVRSQEN